MSSTKAENKKMQALLENDVPIKLQEPVLQYPKLIKFFLKLSEYAFKIYLTSLFFCLRKTFSNLIEQTTAE